MKTTTDAHPDPQAAGDIRKGRGGWCLLLFIGVLVLHRIPLLLSRDFDPDEMQHLHGAYSISRGLTPHVDYFEHHSSWFAWLLSWPLDLIGASWAALISSRALMAVTAAAGLWLTYSLARRLSTGLIPAVAVALHATTLLFVEKSLEVRPDVPAAALWTLAVICTIDGLRGGPRRCFAAAGTALGFGLLFTFKLAFGAIGLGLAVLFIQLREGGWRRVREGIPDLLTLVGWSALPVVLLFLSLAHQDQLAGFVEEVILGPLAWQREVGPWAYLQVLVQGNLLLVGFGGLGLLQLLAVAWRGGERSHAAAVIVLASACILGGWFTIPVPWPQFLMPLWPLLACAGASSLGHLKSVKDWLSLTGAAAGLSISAVTAALLSIHPGALFDPLLVGAVAGAFGLLVALMAGRLGWAAGLLVACLGAAGAGAVMARQFPAEPTGVALVTLGSLCLLAAAARARREEALSVVATCALCAWPLVVTARMAVVEPVDDFRRQFDFMTSTLGDDDAVLTGWTGCAVFQPHAYRYFFLHRGMLGNLDEEAKGGGVLRVLESDPPAAVIRDAGTRGLGPEVQTFLDAHYVPSGVGDIWLER